MGPNHTAKRGGTTHMFHQAFSGGSPSGLPLRPLPRHAPDRAKCGLLPRRRRRLKRGSVPGRAPVAAPRRGRAPLPLAAAVSPGAPLALGGARRGRGAVAARGRALGPVARQAAAPARAGRAAARDGAGGAAARDGAAAAATVATAAATAAVAATPASAPVAAAVAGDVPQLPALVAPRGKQ
jgi:hypothetical protein